MAKYVAFMNRAGECMGFTTRKQFEKSRDLFLEPGEKGVEYDGPFYDQTASVEEVDRQFANLKKLAAEAVKKAAASK